jgi:hypothetical protein
MWKQKSYATRLDRFRALNGLAIKAWAANAPKARSQLQKYRAGKVEPMTAGLANLVCAASAMLRRPVKAAEIMDVGEDEPVAPTITILPSSRRRARTYEGRLGAYCARIQVSPQALLEMCAASRPTIRRVARKGITSVALLRRVVITLRRLGYAALAKDIADVGEN